MSCGQRTPLHPLPPTQTARVLPAGGTGLLCRPVARRGNPSRNRQVHRGLDPSWVPGTTGSQDTIPGGEKNRRWSAYHPDSIAPRQEIYNRPTRRENSGISLRPHKLLIEGEKEGDAPARLPLVTRVASTAGRTWAISRKLSFSNRNRLRAPGVVTLPLAIVGETKDSPSCRAR